MKYLKYFVCVLLVAFSGAFADSVEETRLETPLGTLVVRQDAELVPWTQAGRQQAEAQMEYTLALQQDDPLMVYVELDRSVHPVNGAIFYAVGETMRMDVTVSQDSFVYLFVRRAGGQIDQIFPNSFEQEAGRSNFVLAAERLQVPSQQASYSLGIQGAAGIREVIALASQQELADGVLEQVSRGLAMEQLLYDQAGSSWHSSSQRFFVTVR